MRKAPVLELAGNQGRLYGLEDRSPGSYRILQSPVGPDPLEVLAHLAPGLPGIEVLNIVWPRGLEISLYSRIQALLGEFKVALGELVPWFALPVWADPEPESPRLPGGPVPVPAQEARLQLEAQSCLLAFGGPGNWQIQEFAAGSASWNLAFGRELYQACRHSLGPVMDQAGTREWWAGRLGRYCLDFASLLETQDQGAMELVLPEAGRSLKVRLEEAAFFRLVDQSFSSLRTYLANRGIRRIRARLPGLAPAAKVLGRYFSQAGMTWDVLDGQAPGSLEQAALWAGGLCSDGLGVRLPDGRFHGLLAPYQDLPWAVWRSFSLSGPARESRLMVQAQNGGYRDLGVLELDPGLGGRLSLGFLLDPRAGLVVEMAGDRRPEGRLFRHVPQSRGRPGGFLALEGQSLQDYRLELLRTALASGRLPEGLGQSLKPYAGDVKAPAGGNQATLDLLLAEVRQWMLQC